MRQKVARPMRKAMTKRHGGTLPRFQPRNPLRALKREWNQTPWHARHMLRRQMEVFAG